MRLAGRRDDVAGLWYLGHRIPAWRQCAAAACTTKWMVVRVPRTTRKANIEAEA